MSNLIGQVLLSQYRVDSFIASGGMGAVYRVFDLRRNVPLAMKILHSELAEDPSVFRHFKREATTLEKLVHPNIVQFYGLFQTTEFAFMLEGFVDGPTLKDVLREQGGRPLALMEMLIYLRALCAALGYAHSNGVVHCDVKPGNLMIDRNGIIYLADFGIAHYSESTVTTYASAGTPAYMSPEQIRGESASPAADIYALGIVLFEMATGQRPFRGDGESSNTPGLTAGEKIRNAHLNLQAPDPRSLNPALPPAFSQVVLKTLAKKPQDRFATAMELFQATCAALSVRPEDVPERVPVLAGPPSSFKPAEYPAQIPAEPVVNKRKSIPAGAAAVGVIGICVLAALILLNPGKLAPTATPLPGSAGSQKTSTPASAIMPTNPSPVTDTTEPLPTRSFTPTLFIPTSTHPPLLTGEGSRGLIAFTSGDYGSCQINLYDPVLKSTTRLKDQPFNSCVPSFSWDVRTILFRSTASGGSDYQIFSIALEGGPSKQITFRGNNMEPILSADGQQIVFTRQNSDNSKDLMVMDLNGGNERTIAGGGNWNDDPQWCLDGKIVFESTRDDHKCPNCSGIFQMQPDDPSTTMRLTANSPTLEEFTPACSPDGQWIAFEGHSTGGANLHIWIMRRDGSSARQLTQGSLSEGRPAWSPDGKEIAYTQVEANGTNAIYVLAVDGSHPPYRVAAGFDAAWSKPLTP
jgi:serine/threonine protein kinase